MTYYNTTNQTGNTLNSYKMKARNQDQVILEIFKDAIIYDVELSPSSVYTILGGEYPITSIRRSINTLTKNNELIKINKKRIGMYGRPENIWILNN